MGSESGAKYDVCVIGAGASGMMAAIAAAGAGATTCLLESGDRVGRKILKTGNGRCNLSHVPIDPGAYHGSGTSRIASFIGRFGTDETFRLFEGLGLMIRERDGYAYPYSEQSSAVLDVLRSSVGARGVDVFCRSKAEDVRGRDGDFTVGRRISARKVIICTGGSTSPETGSDGSGFKIASDMGLDVIRPLPALTKLVVSEKKIASLFGVRAKGEVKGIISDAAVRDLKTVSDRGEIQFTRDGISGIPVFNVSGELVRAMDGGRYVRIILDLVPEMSEGEIRDRIISRLYQPLMQDMDADVFFTGMVHKKLMIYAFDLAGIRPGQSVASLVEGDVTRYVHALKNLTFNVTSYYGFEQAQITSGGVHFDEVDDDLQCVRAPGVYLAGEILDVDGACGGYNLQWAWTSGWLAGRAAAGALGYVA